MNNHIIKYVAHPLSNQDVATKNFVDTNASTTADGVVSGDIKLNVGSDLVRSLGCNDLTAGKKFVTAARVRQCYRIPYPIQDYQCLSR